MKKIFIVICIASIPAVLSAQSKKVKLHAYQQAVLPGVQRTTIDESGTTKTVPAKTNTNTFLYLEFPSSKKIDPKHIWINSKLYDVNASVPSLPVVIYNNTIPGTKPDTLLRASSNKVLQLTLAPSSATFKPSSAAKRKMKSNEVALHTIENGKNCYYYLQHIKKLDPVALQ